MVDAARKKHKVKPVWLTTVRRTVAFEDPRGVLESLQDLQPAEVDCFVRDLDRLEPDVERMKVLANAWSLGDTEKAKSHLERFLELAPSDVDAPLAQEMLKYLK